MKVKLVVERGGKRKTLRVEPPVAVLGRARGNAVRIPSAQVSRQHCRLRIADGLVHVEDLGSVNGTFLNGRRVVGRETVRPGDQLDVGPVRFVVEYDISPAVLAKLKKVAREPEPLNSVLDGLADGSLVDEVEELDDVELALDVVGQTDDEDDLPTFDEVQEDDFKPLPAADDDKLKPEFTFNQPWQMPEAGDLREILSQMEDDDVPPPPPKPSPKKKK
ncbi:MAG: FHA domain-containing protein [Gemmataceae bacterium]